MTNQENDIIARLRVTQSTSVIVCRDAIDEIIALRVMVKEYEDNIHYLLNTTKDAVRSSYKGGKESLLNSLVMNYIALRDTSGRKND